MEVTEAVKNHLWVQTKLFWKTVLFQYIYGVNQIEKIHGSNKNKKNILDLEKMNYFWNSWGVKILTKLRTLAVKPWCNLN